MCYLHLALVKVTSVCPIHLETELACITFLRFDKAIQLRACKITIATDIALPRSKTDHFRQGSEVLIPRTHVDACPVRMMECYMSQARITKDSESLIL